MFASSRILCFISILCGVALLEIDAGMLEGLDDATRDVLEKRLYQDGDTDKHDTSQYQRMLHVLKTINDRRRLRTSGVYRRNCWWCGNGTRFVAEMVYNCQNTGNCKELMEYMELVLT